MKMTPEYVASHQEVSAFLEDLIAAAAVAGVYVPVPSQGVSALTFDINAYDDMPIDIWAATNDREQRDKVAVHRFKELARAIGGRWEKNDPKASSYDDSYYLFTNRTRKIGGLDVVLRMDRDIICERVQVSTKPRTIPAQPAVAEHVIDEPVYERECKPLFTQDTALNSAMAAIESDEIVEAELI